MLTRRLIPCLDVDGGRVVKGTRFAHLRDVGDPAALARRYAELGADELVVLDISATNEARAHALDTVRAVRAACAVPLTVGGGVRRVADAEALLAAGADKVAVNSAAVDDPALLTAMAERFGRQCVVLAVDARRRDPEAATGFEVLTRSGRHRTGLDAIAWCVEGVARGAGEVLLTSHDRDGTGEGYDLLLLRAVSAAVTVPVIASGGAASVADLVAGLEAGAAAVLVASLLHEHGESPATLKRQLAACGQEVRP